MAHSLDTDHIETEIPKNIAAQILELRQKRALSQQQLARLAGIPRSTITVMESGSSNPSIITLQKIASALGCKLEELVTAPRSRIQHIPSQKVRLKVRSNAAIKIRDLLPDSLEHLEFDEVFLAAKSTMVGSPHTSGTKEYLVCTRGKLEVNLDGQKVLVEEGDVLAFPGSIKHSYRNVGTGEARFLSLVALAPLY